MDLFNKKNDKDNTIWTISGLTSFVKALLEGNSNLYNLWVRGEVSGFKRAYSGHCYFKLKDSRSVINCVMFKSRAGRVNFDVADGQKLLARGSITVYEKGGNYQLLVEELKPEGLGELYLQFLQLKEELQKKGYFEPERKRPIPFMPKTVGIATSTKGAGLQDMIKIITTRFPPVNIYVHPTTVQGDAAPESISRSLHVLNRKKEVDVIIVGRGGGSFEDLNCFNHRLAADAVYKSKKPVISAVGHETDFTICDMVADYRAETPTAAAQVVVPDLDDLKYTLDRDRHRLARGLTGVLENRRMRLKHLAPQRSARMVESLLAAYRQDLDRFWGGLKERVTGRLKDARTGLKHAGESLNALSPYRVLERGYVIVKDGDTGRYISRAEQTAKGGALEMSFADGRVKTEVIEDPVLEKEA